LQSPGGDGALAAQLSVIVTGWLLPPALRAITVYACRPGAVSRMTHVRVVLVQPSHVYVPIATLQLTSNAANVPTVGGFVCDVRAIVHFGASADTLCHVTVTLEGTLAPAALRATTVYVTGPVAADVVLHCAVALMQFVHVNAVGAFVHEAVSTTMVPVAGAAFDAVTRQTGTFWDADDDGEHIATGIDAGP